MSQKVKAISHAAINDAKLCTQFHIPNKLLVNLFFCYLIRHTISKLLDKIPVFYIVVECWVISNSKKNIKFMLIKLQCSSFMRILLTQTV